jgi:peptidoglycan/LPS O-acetylase OafA/YrhL
VRRILRIWPLYFAMIAVGWFCGQFSPSHALSFAWGASLLLLFTNWYTVGHGYPPGFLFPLWSISVEEQFYLAWPLIVKYLSPGALLGTASLLMAAAYLTLALLLHTGQALDPAIWANGLVQFQFFALGTMAAIVLRGCVPSIPKAMRWALFFVGLFCMRAAQPAVYNGDLTQPHHFKQIAPPFLLVLPGCLCLFFSLLQLPASKRQKPLTYLGKISYGLYVYHVLWLGVAGHLTDRFAAGRLSPVTSHLCAMSLALPATSVSGTLSYRYLESPFLRLKKRFTVILSRPV